jgi:hypothetical protein
MNDQLVVPQFKIHTKKNPAKTKEAARPIFDDMEIVEVRFAGNRQTVSAFPAHAVWSTVLNPQTGDYEPQTYAQRWPDQYRRFKMQAQQVAAGTPVEELPFLTQAKRSELKALSIYTAESLAALDGQELKNLGQGGRELKNQAQAYLDNASGSANVVKMQTEIDELKRTISEMQGAALIEPGWQSSFEDWEDEAIKEWIKTNKGTVPKGRATHATLVKDADAILAKQGAEQ